MVTAYIALGSNLGKRQLALRTALDRIAALPGTQVLQTATFRQTDPVDAPPGSPPFMNSVTAVDTPLGPRELLDQLLTIERSLGRVREDAPRNAPRTIDLDLLLHGDSVLMTDTLTIPHPRLHLRRFVLEPLAEIAPHLVHPRLGKSMRELLARLDAPGDSAAAHFVPPGLEAGR